MTPDSSELAWRQSACLHKINKVPFSVITNVLNSLVMCVCVHGLAATHLIYAFLIKLWHLLIISTFFKFFILLVLTVTCCFNLLALWVVIIPANIMNYQRSIWFIVFTTCFSYQIIHLKREREKKKELSQWLWNPSIDNSAMQNKSVASLCPLWLGNRVAKRTSQYVQLLS